MFNKSYSQYYDLFNHDKPYKKEIEFVYKWAKKPSCIFDIGCGTGNYWQYYPQDTCIVGVDKSKQMADNRGAIIHADITKYKHRTNFDCATALFDVVNYIPNHEWWKNLPLDEGGYWIFDCFDKTKVERDGFHETWKQVGSAFREIKPIRYCEDSVDLQIEVWDRNIHFKEIHRLYIYGYDDILKFCGDKFELVEVRPTRTWQLWVKCRRK